MTESLKLMEHLSKSAKTIEQLIHKIDPSLELCDLKCGSLCQDACPFRDEASYMDCHEVEKAVSQVVSQIQAHIDKRKALATAKQSDYTIPAFGRRAYWEGYIDAKKEDKALLEGSR